MKAYWLKEIRQYASDLVALAEHAADDLQVTEEVLEIKEELKSDEKPVSVKVEHQANPVSPKVQAKEEVKVNPGAPKIDSIKDSTKVAEKRKDSAIDISEIKKTKVEEVLVKEEVKANPGPPKVDSIKDPKIVEKRKDSATNISEAKKTKVEQIRVKEEAKTNPNPSKEESIKDSTKIVEKRKDSATNISEAKKTKVEEANMSRRYSASRYSTSSKVVEGKFIEQHQKTVLSQFDVTLSCSLKLCAYFAVHNAASILCAQFKTVRYDINSCIGFS